MDILVPDNWLKDYLKTKAKPQDIAKYLSLCGPSVERIVGTSSSPVYSIEVTTNRIDSASIYGIAREASVILPRFGVKAALTKLNPKSKLTLSKKVDYLDAKVDSNLCPRFSAILIKNVKIGESPKWLRERLVQVGVRPINNIVDISNYIMHDLGHPLHTFDYDKIGGHKMILRESKKGEKITTLDGKTHSLPGGDIVIEDSKKLIDLAGIMGGANSAVDENTKNVLVFVQTYNPSKIRKTSMALAQRTEAATLFEKGVDAEGVEVALRHAVDMFVNLTQGQPAKKALDIYPNPYKPKKVEVTIGFINKRLGVELDKSEIIKILSSLGFGVSAKGNLITAEVPSFRSHDVEIPEDIVEEVARIYGYHNLPSELMTGAIPNKLPDSPFEFEIKVKRILKELRGIEVYNLSLLSADFAGKNALRLKNPLGADTEYLRTSLMPSLVKSAEENSGYKDKFHLFEMANIYLPHNGQELPKEEIMLAGIFSNYAFREAKGIIETLLSLLNITYKFEVEDKMHFLPNHYLSVKSKGTKIGGFGELENGPMYYEFPVLDLRKASVEYPKYKPAPKYPPQIEDLTFIFPPKSKIGEVVNAFSNIELTDIFEDAYTFRVWYSDPDKTLTDSDVEKLRTKIVNLVKEKFGGTLKG